MLPPMIEAAVRDSLLERKNFSEASRDFAVSLLGSYNIKWAHKKNNKSCTRTETPSFNWKVIVTTPEGNTETKEDEVLRTSSAKDYLAGLLGDLNVNDEKLELIDVHKATVFLPLKGNGKHATGQTDLLLRVVTKNNDYMVAPVELKTTTADISIVQLVFELLAASLVSAYGKAVVVLGTDLQIEGGKWFVGYFLSFNSIEIISYVSSSLALEHFKDLVRQCTIRCQKLQTVAENAKGGPGDDKMQGERGI